MHRISQRLIYAMLVAAQVLGSPATAAPAAPPAAADLDAPEQLGLTAATNLAAVAASLEQQHKGLLAMVEQRTDAVVALHRLAAAAQKEVDRDMVMYANTRGAAVATLFAAITKQGDASADAPAQLDALEAAIRAEVAGGAAVPAVATDKLQAAAKKLAVLAKQQSDTDRIKEWVAFYKDTKAATETLREKADAAKTKSDAASGKAQGALKSDAANGKAQSALPSPNQPL